ncbi:phosphoesterase RecJ domain protein [Pseudodesulfovibrio mercurii]|uniref:Phosphoesterase RecJ domain protein n=1 Tax=Pseudodesulfovibrio mercurii TaxID=641491 RepID=F0JCT3_9BACT|nr:bifunctional oligoribonuclease/PAP phosphatase NrnA [Pseudodesulfovibrio mercurii]EGB13261.1 phosphoesterase RecJ domain protein [Pseudodesulfovibrio mercurii]
MESPIRRISEVIAGHDEFLVASHYSPDGDAIGSICALGHILAALGRKVSLYNPSGLPSRYAFIDLPAPIERDLPDALPAWTFVLDCGSGERMGEALAARAGETRIVNIDHHLGNDLFGEVNWVDAKQPSVGGMIALLADALGVPLTGPLAECVYLAVATDTGFFTYGNTTPESLELAAGMLRNGLDIAGMNERITKQWSENRMKLWTEAMSAMELFLDKRVSATVITKEMFARTGTTNADTENLINFLRRLKTVRVAAILREEGPDLYKFSLRSYGDDNVQKVAARFGGGGHKNAAGGSIQGPLAEVKARLVRAVADQLGIA